MRAVASVCPYMTKRSQPCARAELGEAAHPLGVDPSAGLGDVAQRREVEPLEAGAVEELERVGHAGERRGAGARAARSQKHASATERSVSTSGAPRAGGW